MVTNDKSKWGPPIWQYLHLMTFLYPQKPSEVIQTQYATLFAAVADTLPCETCRTHFKTHVGSPEFKTALKNEGDLMLAKWLVDVHNSVNRRLNKPEKSFAAVRQEYDVMCKNMHCGMSPSVTGPPESPNKTTMEKPQSFWIMVACLSVVGLLVLWGLYHLLLGAKQSD